MILEEEIKMAIRNVPDFPKKGINFKDITPLFQNPKLIGKMVAKLTAKYKDSNIDAVAGIESRGFLLGVPLALALGVPFVLIRKKGKLPYETVSYKYELEYGFAEIEMHIDAILPGQNVLIHDDLLATGGSAEAAAKLIQMQKGKVVGFDFIVELEFLNGRKKLDGFSKNMFSFVKY